MTASLDPVGVVAVGSCAAVLAVCVVYLLATIVDDAMRGW